MSEPGAGWYPDPGGSGGHRYWNGQAWTDHVSPPVTADPSLSDAAAPEVAPAPASAPPPPGAAAGPASGPPPLAAPPPGPMSTPPLGAPVPPGWAPSRPGMAPVGIRMADRRGPDGQILAGWWRRFLGYVLDYLLISLIAGLVVGIAAAVSGGIGDLFNGAVWDDLMAKLEANPGYQPTQAEVQALLGPGFTTLLSWLLVARLVVGFANGVVLVALTGQTVCDRAVGTRKVRAGRRLPGFGPAFLRWLLPEAFVLLMSVPLLAFAAFGAWILDYLWPLWDPQRQTLHDKAAATFVERSVLAGAPN